MTRARNIQKNEYYTTIATKVSKADKAKLVSIADGFGMTFYQLLQGLLLAAVRYFDKGSLVTYDHNAMMNAFANTIFALKGSYNPISLRDHKKRSVCRAILFIEQQPRKQPQLMTVEKDPYGKIVESYNIDAMLADFMGVLDPESLQAIAREQKKQGYFSITHTLHEMLLQRADKPADTMSQEIADMFTDARTTTGEQVNEDIHYKRKPNRGEGYTTPTPVKKRHKVEL